MTATFQHRMEPFFPPECEKGVCGKGHKIRRLAHGGTGAILKTFPDLVINSPCLAECLKIGKGALRGGMSLQLHRWKESSKWLTADRCMGARGIGEKL